MCWCCWNYSDFFSSFFFLITNNLSSQITSSFFSEALNFKKSVDRIIGQFRLEGRSQSRLIPCLAIRYQTTWKRSSLSSLFKILNYIFLLEPDWWYKTCYLSKLTRPLQLTQLFPCLWNFSLCMCGLGKLTIAKICNMIIF